MGWLGIMVTISVPNPMQDYFAIVLNVMNIGMTYVLRLKAMVLGKDMQVSLSFDPTMAWGQLLFSPTVPSNKTTLTLLPFGLGADKVHRFGASTTSISLLLTRRLM